LVDIGKLYKKVIIGILKQAMDLLVEVEAGNGAVEPQLCQLLGVGPELAHLLALLLDLLVLYGQCFYLPLQLLNNVDFLKLQQHGEETYLSYHYR